MLLHLCMVTSPNLFLKHNLVIFMYLWLCLRSFKDAHEFFTLISILLELE
jgi:hypothetical protein